MVSERFYGPSESEFLAADQVLENQKANLAVDRVCLLMRKDVKTLDEFPLYLER